MVSSDTVRLESIKPRGRSRSMPQAMAGTWQFPLVVWVVHFLLTQVPATLAYHYGTLRSVRMDPPRSGNYVSDFGPDSRAYSGSLPPLEPLSGLAHWLVEPFRNWDGTWYMLVASGGYDPALPATSAFWPLYPWLMRIGSDLTGWSPETIGWIVSNLAFMGALYYVYRLVALDFNVSVARRTLWAMALFPTAFFFTAVYTESLFLFLLAAGLYYARRGEWLLAGLIGLLAALTRSAGVMILAPYGILFLQQFGWSIRAWFPRGIAAALPALGPVIFGWTLQRAGLDFLDWADQQWQWNRFSANPIRTFDCAINGCVAEVRFISGQSGPATVHPTDWGWAGELWNNLNWSFFTSSEFRFRFGESHVLELIVSIAAILLVLIGIRMVPLYYTVLVVPALVIPLLTPSSVNPLMSMPRFVLPLFPLFVVAALLIRQRRLGWILAGGSSVLLVLLTMQFALWYWVS